MKSYKEPSFQDRVGRAADAKRKALDALRAKPPVDERVLAERQAARLQREAAAAEKRAAKKAAEDEAKAEKAKAAEAARAAAPVALTEAEKKLARDARYAARKSRK
jgi:hypothetical protein